MSTLKEICKEQTEMIDEMRQNIRELTKESKQYKSERDTLIGDIAVLKANISRLESELSTYKKSDEVMRKTRDELIEKVEELEREKKEREKRAEEAMTLAEEANCQVVSLQELLEINESSTKDLILKLQNSDTQKIEDENKELKRLAESRKGTIKGLKRHVKDLRLQSNTYFDEWQTVKNLYTTLTNHIRMKAEHNPGVSRYIDLVNYIDRLERADDEKI